MCLPDWLPPSLASRGRFSLAMPSQGRRGFLFEQPMSVGSLLLALEQVELSINCETLTLSLALRLVESFSANLPGFEAERVEELHSGPRFRIDASHDLARDYSHLPAALFGNHRHHLLVPRASYQALPTEGAVAARRRANHCGVLADDARPFDHRNL